MANSYRWDITREQTSQGTADSLGITIWVNNVLVVDVLPRTTTAGTFTAETGDTIKCGHGLQSPIDTAFKKWVYNDGTSHTSYDDTLEFTAPAVQEGLTVGIVNLWYTKQFATLSAEGVTDQGNIQVRVSGSIAPSPSPSQSATIHPLDSVALQAYPIEGSGYHFKQWEYDDNGTWVPYSISNPISWTVHPDWVESQSYRAVFSQATPNYVKFETTGTSTIYLQNTVLEGSSFTAPNCQYCFDPSAETPEWLDVPTSPHSTPITISTATGGNPCVYFRGSNSKGFTQSSNYPSSFKVGGDMIEVTGNVMSLVDGYGEIDFIPGQDGCFACLFMDCDKLKSVSSTFLPATTLNSNCYAWMFKGCTQLITAPNLPSESLYYSCYAMMFANCSYLTTPPELPATTLIAKCYYYMFSGCSSLLSSPNLEATTSATACYEGMFRDCVNLRTVFCYLDTPNSENTKDWLSNVSYLGRVYTASNEWSVGESAIPAYWDNVNIHSHVLTFASDAYCTCNPSSFQGTRGESVTVTVTPITGRYFYAWNDGVTSNPRVFTVGSEDETFTANTRVAPSAEDWITGMFYSVDDKILTYDSTTSTFTLNVPEHNGSVMCYPTLASGISLSSITITNTQHIYDSRGAVADSITSVANGLLATNTGYYDTVDNATAIYTLSYSGQSKVYTLNFVLNTEDNIAINNSYTDEGSHTYYAVSYGLQKFCTSHGANSSLFELNSSSATTQSFDFWFMDGAIDYAKNFAEWICSDVSVTGSVITLNCSAPDADYERPDSPRSVSTPSDWITINSVTFDTTLCKITVSVTISANTTGSERYGYLVLSSHYISESYYIIKQIG